MHKLQILMYKLFPQIVIMCELQGVVPSIATYFFSTLYRTLATILAPTVAHGNGQIPVKVVNEVKGPYLYTLVINNLQCQVQLK